MSEDKEDKGNVLKLVFSKPKPKAMPVKPSTVDVVAIVCTCGSTHFTLMGSGKVVCARCPRVFTEVNWSFSKFPA